MRPLKADEIQCRAQIVKEKGFSILLYKDARCDMNILDETYGEFGWQKEYERIGESLFCKVSIKDSSGEWITKQDVGSESNTEAEKGQASDAFKRACFNWGIGRELYTAPFIWINPKSGEIYKRKKDGKYALKPSVNLKVSEITTEDGVIQSLTIIDDNLDVRFKMGSGSPKQKPHVNGKQTRNKQEEDENPWLNEGTPEWDKTVAKLESGQVDTKTVYKHFKVSKKNRAELEEIERVPA